MGAGSGGAGEGSPDRTQCGHGQERHPLPGRRHGADHRDGRALLPGPAQEHQRL